MNEIDGVLRPMIEEARRNGRKKLRDVLLNAGLKEHEAEKTLEKAQEEGS